MSYRADLYVSDTPPTLDKRIEFKSVGRRQLGGENFEFEVQDVALVFEDGELSNHLGFGHRRHDARFYRRIETRARFGNEVATNIL